MVLTRVAPLVRSDLAECPNTGLRLARLVRSTVHALHVCQHDILARVYADLLHVPYPSHIFPDG